MKNLVLTMVVAVTVSFTLCGSAHAEANVHDGFFLRLAPGIGWNETSNNSLTLSGASGFFNVAIGGAVSQDLILHLDVSAVSTSDPKVSGGGSYTNSSTSLVGLGATYYLPSNFYLTGAFGMAKSKNTSGGIEGSTDSGLGVNLMVGKEWWVSDDWGIGIAGQFLYTSCPDKQTGGYKPDVKSTSIGLLFSATYN